MIARTYCKKRNFTLNILEANRHHLYHRARNYGISKNNGVIRIEQVHLDDQSKLQRCAITTIVLCHNSELFIISL